MHYEELIEREDYWPLQIIQDEYARALDIPLRIFKVSLAEKLWETFAHPLQYRIKFNNKKVTGKLKWRGNN